MPLRTIKNVDFEGKKVLYRVDYNVPLKEDGIIRDDTRIRETLPTIKYMREKGAKIIILTHLGRPKGEKKLELSLKPVSEKLSEILGINVPLIDNIFSEETKNIINNLKNGEVILFENLRFYKEEEKESEEFAEKLSEYGDIYVSDAFAVSHRAIPQFFFFQLFFLLMQVF